MRTLRYQRLVCPRRAWRREGGAISGWAVYDMRELAKVALSAAGVFAPPSLSTLELFPRTQTPTTNSTSTASQTSGTSHFLTIWRMTLSGTLAARLAFWCIILANGTSIYTIFVRAL